MQSNQDVPIVVTVNHGDSGDTNMEDAPNFEPYLAGHHKVNDQGCLDITNQSYKWPTDSGSLTSPLETSSGAAGGNKYRKLPAIPIKTAEDNQDSSLLAAKQQPSFLTSTEDYLQRQLDEQERKYRQSESAAKDLTIKLGSTLSKLEDAQNQRNELETQLSLTHFELDKEHNQRLNLETKLKESDHQLEDIRKRWKQSAKELGQLLKANNQALYQVTDSYLIGLTEQLQYNLRTFAIQHFSSPPRTAFGNSRAEFSPYLEKVSSDYKLYVNSPQHCHRVVQGFLWRVLCDRLFCQYYWMPSSHGKAPAGLAELLRPSMSTPSADPEILPEMATDL
jgi:hypothetical protein